MLEKAFVVFRLPSLSRNLRNEIKKGRKVYFYDNGIRNSIINNYKPLALRNDIGQLWENFLVSERKKRNQYKGFRVNAYFWRTHAQQEIDYIEEQGGELSAFEFKWNSRKKVTFSKTFLKAYPGVACSSINRENFNEFVF